MGIGRSVASLFVRMGLDASGLRSGAAQARAEVKGLQGEMAGGAGSANLLDAALQKLGAVGLVMAAGKAVDLVVELGKLGAQSLQVRDALEGLTRGTGTNMNKLVRAVQQAAGGTVSEFDTMLALNKGILLKMGTDVQQWADLMEVARFKARAMGVDTTQALSDITTGIGRESRMILDNLGIILDTDAVMSQYAASINKAASELDAFERKQALMTAVISEGQAQMAAAGGMTDNYADSFSELSSTLADLKMEIAEGLTPAVAGFAEGITTLITEARKLEEVKAQFQWLIDALEFFEGVRGGGAIADIIGAEQAENARDVAAALEDVARARELLAKAEEFGSPEQVAYYRGELEKAQAALGDAAAANAAAAAAADGATVAYEANREALVGVASAAQGATSALGIFAQASDSWFSMYKGIVSQVPEPFREVWGIIDAEQERLRANFIRDAVLKGDAETEAARETEAAWERAMDEQRRGLEELRGVVQSALKPTQVTAEDLGLAALGEYVEKWDENARRLDAVAERGFAELDAHPDWAAMLKIPESTLAAGEQALKDWARRTAESVRGLERPDLLNIDAAVQAVQDELNRQAAVELSLDLVTKAAIDQGMVTGEDAKDQVAAALGLSQALPVSLTVTDDERERFVAGLGTVPVPVTFSTGETEGAEAGGLQEMMATAVDGVAAGWEQSLQEVPWMQTLSVTMLADIKASEGRLKEVGAAIGAPLWDGLLGRVRGSGIVNHIVAEVLAALVKETK